MNLHRLFCFRKRRTHLIVTECLCEWRDPPPGCEVRKAPGATASNGHSISVVALAVKLDCQATAYEECTDCGRRRKRTIYQERPEWRERDPWIDDGILPT